MKKTQTAYLTALSLTIMIAFIIVKQMNPAVPFGMFLSDWLKVYAVFFLLFGGLFLLLDRKIRKKLHVKQANTAHLLLIFVLHGVFIFIYFLYHIYFVSFEHNIFYIAP